MKGMGEMGRALVRAVCAIVFDVAQPKYNIFPQIHKNKVVNKLLNLLLFVFQQN